MHHDPAPANSNPFDTQIERTAERLGVKSEHVRELVDEWMFARPARWLRLFRRRSLLRRIDEFRARGGKTAVVSDYPASRKLAAMGIADWFDAVIASGEPGGPGQLKPNPAGYQIAAAALGLNPGQCLVIGDRDDADGEAARRAQMQFLHVASRWTT
jgi:HAD superfamily hydrolase (TIGR01549 family)